MLTTKLFAWLYSRVSGMPLTIAGVLSIAAISLISDDAWGRAGGGGGFGGGGGGGGGGFSGGSSGSGGGGGIALAYLIKVLLWDYPYIGWPMLIVFLYLSYKGSKQAKEAHTTGRIVKGAQRNIQAAHAEAVDSVSRHDPDFSMEIFSARVQNAFNKAQNAWCAQEILPIRPFVSDGIYERWTLQVDEQKKSGIRDQMDDITIHSVLLDNYEICGGTEEITVRITASACDYQVNTDNGKRTSGSATPERFTEYWTFLRRKGTKTLRDKNGLMEGNCPNCGAPIGINEAARCGHCGALLRSGEYDWVLSEITQESAYTVNASSRLPGVMKLQEDDPELSPRMIEDRASVIFWRWAIALQQQKTASCRGCCSNDFLLEMQKELKVNSGQFYNNCAVGAVDLLGIITGEEFNQAVVEITWSGIKASLNAKGMKNLSDKCIYRQLLILQRKVGVKSVKANGVGSAHCPGCGAPENSNDSGQCTYCGFLLNDGSSQWVLENKYSRSTTAGRETIARLREIMLNSNDTDNADSNGTTAGFNMSAYALMAWLCKLAASDGEISESEIQALRTTAKARNLPPDIINHMLQAAQSGNLDAPTPENLEEAQVWLQALARLALADGKVSQGEKDLMLAAGKKLNFSEFDIDAIIKRQRAQLLQQLRKKS